MTELERLRADLEVFERHGLIAEASFLRGKIARLEAAAPWQEAKNILDAAKEYGGFAPTPKGFAVVVKFFDHMTAENERLTKRVAELEEARTIPIAACDGEPSDPILDPARTWATVAAVWAGTAGMSRDEFQRFIDAKRYAKPYPLKGTSDGE